MHSEREVSGSVCLVHRRFLRCCQVHGGSRRSRFQRSSGQRAGVLTTWRLRPARRGGFGLGLGPHTAAAPAPGWGGPRAPGTERTGPPPSSRAPGGRPGAQGDSPREDRPLRPTLPRRGLSRRAPGAAGTRCSPALGRGLGRVFILPAADRAWLAWPREGPALGTAARGVPLSFATEPWPRGDLTSRSFNFLPSQVCMILILPSSEGCCEHSSMSLQ